MKLSRIKTSKLIAGVAIAVGLLTVMGVQVAVAQNPPVFPPDKPPQPGSLKTVQVPLPANLADYVVDRQAAIELGKALFWDQQAGSDGLACASCHFQAGADNRVKNQLDPGLRNTLGSPVSDIFNLTASNKNLKSAPPGGGPNYTLKKADFPFHQLADPNDPNSAVIFDTNDVVSSQGVFHLDTITHIKASNKDDFDKKKAQVCSATVSPIFSVNGINVRQVEPRNTPTVINAIFNYRNFWDGRANNVFNGRDPFGYRDPTAGVDPLNSILVGDGHGNLVPFPVSLEDASLASQAVGPPLSSLEMSCAGRVFEEIGRKLLKAQPLAGQTVDPTDSVLGPLAPKGNGKKEGTAGTTGLKTTYEALIKQAFQPKFWKAKGQSADGYSQIEKNFSLFWGVSIMMYESTLVSDNSPFDQWAAGNPAAMTDQQTRGFLEVFMAKGGCVFCHKGPEFTGAATSLRELAETGSQVEHMIMGDGTVALYDSGFYNIGVRPPVEDIGAGGTDPWGNPLSLSREVKAASATDPFGFLFTGVNPDQFFVNTCNFQVDPCLGVTPDQRDAVDGSFKVPTLRNVELTGPFFHNGGQATLAQVIDFYNRGGDARGTNVANTTAYQGNPTNRAPAIGQLGLTADDKANLLAFLKALTDDRVRWEQAPFDHPSLQIPNGSPKDQNSVTAQPNSIQAVESYLNIPAVGAAGRAAKKLGPLVPFDAGLK